MVGVFVFDGENLPSGVGAVNRGDRRAVVRTHRGKRSLNPREALIVGGDGSIVRAREGDRVVPLIGGGYRVEEAPRLED